MHWWRLGTLLWTFLLAMEANALWEQLSWGTQQVTEPSPHQSSISQTAPICLQNQLCCNRAARHSQRTHGWKLLCRLPPEMHFVSTSTVQRDQRLEEDEEPCLIKLPSRSVTALPGRQGVMKISPGPITSAKLSPEECFLSVLACWLQVRDFYTEARLQVTVFHSRISIFLLANEERYI